jgi:hypothetical protein
LGNFVDEEALPKYIKGLMNKYTMEEREIYNPDVKRIQDDMKGNDITLNTFYYLNKDFDFTKKFTNTEEDDKEEEKLESGHKGKYIMLLKLLLYRSPTFGTTLNSLHHRRRA